MIQFLISSRTLRNSGSTSSSPPFNFSWRKLYPPLRIYQAVFSVQDVCRRMMIYSFTIASFVDVWGVPAATYADDVPAPFADKTVWAQDNRYHRFQKKLNWCTGAGYLMTGLFSGQEQPAGLSFKKAARAIRSDSASERVPACCLRLWSNSRQIAQLSRLSV